MAKYNKDIYKTSSFHGGNNINFNLTTWEDKIDIMVILQSYVCQWYHMNPPHPGMDIIEASIG